MKRKQKRAIILIILLPILMLTSCFTLPEVGSSAYPSPAVSEETAGVSPAAATDWHSGVLTDYSYLTPYTPPAETYTRLHDGAMTALEPSNQYGALLPYVGEMMYSDDGYNTIRKYGLVTKDGMIVTDPVYADAYQGNFYDYSSYTSENMPVYILSKLKDTIDEENMWDSEVRAVCALDGSWVTGFEYESIYCTGKVILLVRDTGKNDIDVMDYKGKLLYSTKTLGCYGDIPESSAYSFMSGYGEGLIAVPLSGGRSVIIDALTGHETFIDFEQCSAFSEGRAAVMQDGLYGYIDRSFNLVIPPQSLWFDYFHNGKSIIQYPDQSYAIIDADGNILLENPYYISKWDSNTYGVCNSDNSMTYYDGELQKITPPESQQITPLYGGWYFYKGDNSVTIFKGDEAHMFKDAEAVYDIRGDLVVVYSSLKDTYREGVMTLDGQTVIPMEDAQSIYLVTSEKSDETYIIASTYFDNQTYKVYDSSGSLLFAGSGYASYNATFDLFEVNDELSFAYVDRNGSDVFRLSLLKYMPD
jgi:hypothetical protein